MAVSNRQPKKNEKSERVGTMSKANSLKKFATLVCLSVATIAHTGENAAAADSDLQTILENGLVRIGVQGANKPFSYRDADGSLMGVEVDLAKSIADTMGVKLELVVVTSANRMEFLEQGKIDVLVGSMYDTAERRKAVGIIEPGYWSTGPTLMAKKGVIKSWEDIKGKPVCGKQGTLYNKSAETQYGAKIIAFTGNSEAKEALRSQKCVAFIYENASIQADLLSGEWNDYEMPVSIMFDNPWGIAVPLDQKDKLWGTFLSGVAYRWQANGFLLELEEKWKLNPTKWLHDQHAKHKWDDSYLSR